MSLFVVHACLHHCAHKCFYNTHRHPFTNTPVAYSRATIVPTGTVEAPATAQPHRIGQFMSF